MARKDEELEMHDDEYVENDDTLADDDSADDEDGESGSKKVLADSEDSTGSAIERQKLREAMAADVEAFLARGGNIQTIEANVMADPPRKPQTNYGSRPI